MCKVREQEESMYLFEDDDPKSINLCSVLERISLRFLRYPIKLQSSKMAGANVKRDTLAESDCGSKRKKNECDAKYLNN
ncbi:hypothetical protein WN51_12962 [Melipona quadrifasciata]|uniref:Uncharacterized protein n=1 Tax=Melipona quadrifasciata TaxID=166423 RepID=A0A0M9ACR6_9HYME|nr:hypothetical protein WN51_12962 [Melipona quadrifasciata]